MPVNASSAAAVSHPTGTDIPGALRARFNPLIRPYLVLQVGFVLIMTVVGIPLALLWFLGVGQWWARHYFDRLECQLDANKLRFRKGIIVTVEKTIPLENIQDVTFIEGPLLRHFHLSTLKFETAGSGAGQAHDMHLTGIIDAHDFRNRILEARDQLKQTARHVPAEAAAASAASADAHLAALRAIEQRLGEVVELLRAQQR